MEFRSDAWRGLYLFQRRRHLLFAEVLRRPFLSFGCKYVL
nr:MAG TPA: hypothetical protein [Caudoviricetes sp.]